MKNGWAAEAPEFGKLIVPSVAFWPVAGDATSQHAKLHSNNAPAERRRVNTGAPHPPNGDVTLMLAIANFLPEPYLHNPPNHEIAQNRVWSVDGITVTAWTRVIRSGISA